LAGSFPVASASTIRDLSHGTASLLAVFVFCVAMARGPIQLQPARGITHISRADVLFAQHRFTFQAVTVHFSTLADTLENSLDRTANSWYNIPDSRQYVHYIDNHIVPRGTLCVCPSLVQMSRIYFH